MCTARLTRAPPTAAARPLCRHFVLNAKFFFTDFCHFPHAAHGHQWTIGAIAGWLSNQDEPQGDNDKTFKLKSINEYIYYTDLYGDLNQTIPRNFHKIPLFDTITKKFIPEVTHSKDWIMLDICEVQLSLSLMDIYLPLHFSKLPILSIEIFGYIGGILSS